MFEDLSKTVKEGQERWKRIEELAEEIGSVNNYGPDIKPIIELLLLMVEHMRPMNPSQEQLDEATKGIEELLSSLKR